MDNHGTAKTTSQNSQPIPHNPKRGGPSNARGNGESQARHQNMIEFWNVIAVFISGLIAGAAIHSAWLHSKKRGEFKRKWGH